MYHHGPPGIVGSTEGDALENNAASFSHQDAQLMSFYDDRKRGPYTEPESLSKRSDDDDSFPTIDELFARSRKRSRSSESESSHDLSKRCKHGKRDFDQSPLIAVSPSWDEPGSPHNPIDVDRAAPGSSENPLLVDTGEWEPPENRNAEVPDDNQFSTEEDSQLTILQEPGVFAHVDSIDSNKENAEPTSPTFMPSGDLAGSSDEASTDDGDTEHNVPDPPAALSPDGSSTSLASVKGNIQRAIAPTVLDQTPEGGSTSLVTNHAYDSGSASTTIGDYGILRHRWISRKLELLVLRPMWVLADDLERDDPRLVECYKQDKKITALRQSPRLNQPQS